MPNQPTGACYLHQIPPTPLVPVSSGAGLAPIWCKLEFLNPSGSTKDRIARHILEKARRRGALSEGGTVVEASSGSTSIALALACAQLRLRFVAFIPESATSERSLMIQAYGGEVRRVEGGMAEVLRAAESAAEEFGWFHTRQFSNPDNVEAHRLGGRGDPLADPQCLCRLCRQWGRNRGHSPGALRSFRFCGMCGDAGRCGPTRERGLRWQHRVLQFQVQFRCAGSCGRGIAVVPRLVDWWDGYRLAADRGWGLPVPRAHPTTLEPGLSRRAELGSQPRCCTGDRPLGSRERQDRYCLPRSHGALLLPQGV